MRRLFAVLFALSCFCVNSHAEDKFAIGVNYLGGQIRYHLSPKWAAEGRYLTGTEDAAAGEVKASVGGLRGYRFFGLEGKFRFFLGAEVASVSAKQTGSTYKVSGMASGAFGGMEYRMGRLALGLDMGPYVMALKEKSRNVSDTSLEFVLNSYFTFYLF